MRRGLVGCTVVSLVVVGGWSAVAAASMGPAPVLHLSWRHPVASYVALAAAPTGNGLELFIVVAVVYAVCLFTALWRGDRR